MPYFYIRPIFGGLAAGGDRFSSMGDAVPFVGSRPRIARSADRAIDAALRSVPLPEGLMTRLGKLVYTLTDDAADQLDYLGC